MQVNKYNILLSVILPVYNGEKYINAAIKSVDLEKNPQCEIIIIDDGSVDTTETIIGCSNILKNAVGIIGLIIIIGIVLMPIIKILTLWIAFCLTSAICEVIADEKIVKLTTQISDSYKILLAILFSVSVMFLISITLVLKITNNVVM